MGRIVLLVALVSMVAACSGSESLVTTTVVTSPEPEENESFGSYMTRCVAEYGIAAIQTGDQGFFIPGGHPQEPAQRRAVDACDEKATEAGIVVYLDRSDPVALAERYAGLVEVYECLARNELAGDPPPSEETFIDTGGIWNPYDSMSRGNRIEGDEVCPSDFFSHVDLTDYWNPEDGEVTP